MLRRSLIASLLATLPAAAAPVAAPHVTVELVAERAALQPGRDLDVGLRFVLEDGWHVYWRNPGDSGEAPRVEWTLPEGFAAGPLAWPAPERIPVGPLANFGYERAVLLPALVRVPSTLPTTASIEIAAHASWLVCDPEECIPGSATLHLGLPASTTPPGPSPAAPLFAAARARLPTAPPPGARFTVASTGETLVLAARGLQATDGSPLFFPHAREVIEHAAPQRLTRHADGFDLEVRRWVQATGTPTALDGVLVIGDRAYTVTLPLAATGPPLAPFALAFVGGLLLNLMPCVFPVLALKALGLTGLARGARHEARLHGLVYAAGVVTSFWALAGVLLAARAGGAPLGWGFQLQSPVVVAGLAGLFFWMALTLLGVCSIGGSFMGIGNRVATAGGTTGAFASGVLATVVATPCTAPFMGTALGYALVQPPTVAVGVFTALALGLAAPYVVLTWLPGLGRRLPRPGAWMETLEQTLAFPLLATVVWLTWVASLQGGPDAVRRILTGLLLLGIAAWIAGRWRRRTARLVATAFVLGALWVGTGIEPSTEPRVAGAAASPWEPWSRARLRELADAGRPVFVDFTAAWCVTCQVNERVALDTPAVTAKMRAIGVVPLRADWTRPDPEITHALAAFGRQGVPLYVLYTGSRDDAPRILPQLLTETIVLTELEALEKENRT